VPPEGIQRSVTPTCGDIATSDIPEFSVKESPVHRHGSHPVSDARRSDRVKEVADMNHLSVGCSSEGEE